jgi:type IV secretory pathway TrbL component
MFVQPPTLSAVTTGIVDLTYDFAPLFLGLVVGVCLCVLALAFIIGMHDTWRLAPQSKRSPEHPTLAHEFHDAA